MNNNILSQRVQSVEPSVTLSIASVAAELKAAGEDVISLSVGEPDFHTPSHIKQAGIDAINNNQTKYTAVDGIPTLKQAIINKFKNDNDLDYTPSQILVSSGGKQSFYNLCQATINPADEVIIPAPYWVSYPPMVQLASGVPVIVQTNMADDFKITPQQLEEAITNKTKLFVINSPSNPTGFVYNKQELKNLSEVLLKYPKILIATDDMYEHIQWTGDKFVNILNAEPKLYDRVMILNGVSKAYAMTGWRIGYCAGDKNIIKAMKKVQSQSTSNPCTISQMASISALAGDQKCVNEMNKEFIKRADLMNSLLNQIDGVKCNKADGTFYAFANCSGLIQKLNLKNDVELSSWILKEAQVAIVPGTAFGCDNHLRFSFATDEATLTKAIDKIKQAIANKTRA
ncbi:MAG: aspartate transaminase [Gammaproteobacteria bacterium]|nr:MAG: aspartate transaminase [Gammaproteobacteria bacterium]